MAARVAVLNFTFHWFHTVREIQLPGALAPSADTNS
jgi:hypothetical protein